MALLVERATSGRELKDEVAVKKMVASTTSQTGSAATC
jgi:hypothetical protein